MKYLLDTDHISILQMRSEPRYSLLTTKMREVGEGDVCYSIVSFHEQVIGVHAYLNRGKTPEDLAKGYDRLSRLRVDYEHRRVLAFDREAAITYDSLGGRLKINAMDLRIAAIALSRGLILLTSNRRDFDKIANLPTEDWTN